MTTEYTMHDLKEKRRTADAIYREQRVVLRGYLRSTNRQIDEADKGSREFWAIDDNRRFAERVLSLKTAKRNMLIKEIRRIARHFREV